MTATGEMKRLYKSRTDRMIDGVCGGIAEYFSFDSTLVRIVWVLLTLLGGAGVILYILAMIIMPKAPFTLEPSKPRVSVNNQKFWGILLITVGIVWLLGNWGIPLWSHWWHFSWDVALAVILILAGVAFMFGGRSYVQTPVVPDGSASAAQGPESTMAAGQTAAPIPRLHRSRTDRKLFGVCGGLGAYFRIDPTIIRLLFVVSAIASVGFTLLLYIAMAIIVPEESIVPRTS